MWLIIWIAIVYLIIAAVVGILSNDWNKGLFWILYITDDLDDIDFD